MMPIVFKGGTSGCREDYAAPDIPIENQPVSQTGPVPSHGPAVKFDGATSGNREDAKPPEVGYKPQPVIRTENKSDPTPGLQLPTNKSTHPAWNTATPDFLPTGGTPNDSAI